MPNRETAYLDCDASFSILGRDAKCKISPTQLPNISLNTPSHVPITTTKTLELLLHKLPLQARKAFLVEDIPHNLVAVAELVDAGCSVHLYAWGFDIDLEGETLYKDWREGPQSRLFRMNLTDDKVGPCQPQADPTEWDQTSRTQCENLQFSASNIYECENKNQLLLYYHASLGSHPKRVLAAAAKAGYLQG